MKNSLRFISFKGKMLLLGPFFQDHRHTCVFTLKEVVKDRGASNPADSPFDGMIATTYLPERLLYPGLDRIQWKHQGGRHGMTRAVDMIGSHLLSDRQPSAIP